MNTLYKYFTTNYEKNFDSQESVKFANDYIKLPFLIVTIYLILIKQGIKYMEYKTPFNLKKLLFLWNGLLCIFSFIGSIKTTPDLLNQLIYTDFKNTICKPCREGWGNGTTGFWVMLFVYSKIPELFDTYFIVCRKRPLLFLHWYHHVTVLLYCWHSYSTEASQALYFVTMNYTVHSIMYGYYCLMILKMKPVWLNPAFITMCQISQMIVGIFIQLSSLYLYYSDGRCSGLNKNNMIWGGLMYLSYFGLFTKFAIDRYTIKEKK
jgi:elongation of very long chain fatty acids protein 6